MTTQNIIDAAESIANQSERTIKLSSLAMVLDNKGFNWCECPANQDKWHTALDSLRADGYTTN